jgi:VanZ family protein
MLAGQDNVTDNLVRKLAHFVEYGALGCVLALLLTLLKRRRWQSVVNCAFAVLIVALTDETIQIFTGRGSQVQDVWLDFAGACAGILLVLIVVGLIKAIRRGKNERRRT